MDNDTVKRYEELQAVIKKAEKELSDIKQGFIQAGGLETNEYLVVIKDSFRELVAGKDAFALKFGSDWLKDNGLLKLSTFNTVVVARKNAVKVG